MNKHAIGYAALQDEGERKVNAPILDRDTFHWNSAASHSDSSKFRARQEARRVAAQSKTVANVTAIKPPKKDAKA